MADKKKAVNKEDLPYRPCVGVMLINADGNVFVARRIDTDLDAWQMPQGGIDKGEEPQEAALRELLEEIGTNNVTVLGETLGWMHYDLPDELIGKVWKGKYRGQKQKWFLCRFQGQDSDISLETEHPEFNAWQWLPFDQVPEKIVEFKRAIYEAVCAEFASLVKG